MRAFAFTGLVCCVALAALGGCIDHETVRAQNFVAGPNGSFTYSAHTDTVMTENDDGAAEQIRRDWLAQTLEARGMCRAGYVVYQRRLVIPPQRLALSATPGMIGSGISPAPPTYFGNGGDVVYVGSCL